MCGPPLQLLIRRQDHADGDGAQHSSETHPPGPNRGGRVVPLTCASARSLLVTDGRNPDQSQEIFFGLSAASVLLTADGWREQNPEEGEGGPTLLGSSFTGLLGLGAGLFQIPQKPRDDAAQMAADSAGPAAVMSAVHLQGAALAAFIMVRVKNLSSHLVRHYLHSGLAADDAVIRLLSPLSRLQQCLTAFCATADKGGSRSA